jgi:3-oxoacyl-[acyl-carrier protein] reductase
MAGVEGRVALVTGAGSADGIGFACAQALHMAGARVAITSTTARIHDRLRELGSEWTFAAAADLTREEEVRALVAETRRALGPIDILVNNAGMVQTGRRFGRRTLARFEDEAWEHGLAINLTSAMRLSRAVLPSMMRRGYGRIVHMSSVTGPVVAIPGSGAYGAAKAGLLGLTREMAIEVAAKGVTVNCIGPGWIRTGSSSSDEIIAGRHTPVGRPGTPMEIAHVARFLASEEASYLTGQMIVVDGGNTIQEFKVAL